MTDPAYFLTLARYNRWANARLYGQVAELTDHARKANRQGFFGSIHNTLNHILVGDRLWLSRFPGEPAYSYRLDDVPYEDFAELQAERQAQDRRILDFVAAMDADTLASDLSYTNVAGQHFVMARRLILAHLFNHQTHHRGQAHHMLGTAGVEPQSLDLMHYLREQG
ncbi:MAG: DinB family protein [Alphaproteobacteria bacterium]|nr:DinB family protein [Alphaproteobacteria bacterium]MBU0795918.1 DinB family protein [Alphaproteobacteria bacterium]MBU0886955.1 DinB family protein [Alphaproteobacteria bacterium]MBU1813189.1 DinB family protein [Alphaproteobacteria bacterium]MBU2090757.1 DinB family protein [Alphaproteobacteria bacterium]